jgi:hypothetical protein
MRFRPIVMTSLAFILGCVPMAIARARAQQPALHRHRRDRRHARLDADRVVLRAAVLRPARRPQRSRGGPAQPARPPAPGRGLRHAGPVARRRTDRPGMLAAGCAVGPDYERPEVDLPEDWRVPAGEAGELANTRWWTQFSDPVLDELIATALAENLDVRIAAARVAQFAGALEATRSQFCPQIGYGGGAGRSRSSEFLLPAGADPYTPSTRRRSARAGSWTCSAGCGVNRRRPRPGCTRASRAGAASSCRSSAASPRVTSRCAPSTEQLEISQATAANYKETLGIFELRHRRASSPGWRWRRSSRSTSRRSQSSPCSKARSRPRNTCLSILLGTSPGPIPRGRALAELSCRRSRRRCRPRSSSSGPTSSRRNRTWWPRMRKSARRAPCISRTSR